MPNSPMIYATRMQEEGIYVTGFYYPVVPKDRARIRVQISAGHESIWTNVSLHLLRWGKSCR